MSFEYSQEISNDYEKLFENKKGYDVVIYAGENENLKEIHAHSLILRTRSQYFNTTFCNNLVKKENGKFIFKKPNISSNLFEIILRFIYCGKIDLKNLQGPEMLKLSMVADELNVPTLIFCIQNLEAPLLEFLLKQHDLNLSEIEIWEGLIKWGLAQDQELNKDVSKWNQEDFNIFKKILNKFIPLIRFYGISNKDYFDKVKPYEEILPKELREEISKFHQIPGYKPTFNLLLPRYNIDSNLANRKHFTIFASWIDKERGKLNYKFNLLYRASRDGDTAEAFHAKCDCKGATIVVAKITNSEQIVGGYNPLEWDSNNCIAYSKEDQYSIRCYRHCGPFFGYGDLYTNYAFSYVWQTEFRRSYPTLNLPDRMNVDDYEVFQVIKK
ncbi:hypothetical protein GLOIN_2v1835332 [Rhizophagus irregularis DAOM 181602=DAOM 197198]|nr:hypothetical protein GLOIN_2v1835332 [Rhizophagus irregularis DAOM 181602=DAOM 197198]